MKSNNLNVLTYGYNPIKYPCNWFHNIKQFLRNIKYAYQRITRGYCDQDVWNMDYFYSELFYQSLNTLADITIGYPGVNEFSDENGGFEAWKQYLKEMAEHFKNTQEDEEEIPINISVSEAWEEMNKYVISSKFVPEGDHYIKEEKYSDEEKYNKAKDKWWKLEKNAAKFRNSEKNKAFDMMKKYFFSLWD